MAQLTLNLEPGIDTRNRSLKECVAAGIYSRGVVAVAGKIDAQPSHLSEALSGGGRKFDVDDLEKYIAATGDVMPIHYLVAKYLRDPQAQQQEAMAQLTEVMKVLPGLIAAAGLGKAKR
jgi:hypothetical protein